MSDTLTLAQELIRCESVTPDDAGCQSILKKRLEKMGFTITEINSNGVSNFWAIGGKSKPLLIFAGHTDVVPPGPLDQWSSPPFAANVIDNKLIGRGAADMKSSIAAMIIACEKFIEENPNYSGSIAFMITSDEEGEATDGTKKIVEYCQQQKIKPDYCLIGEASSEKKLGDTIKIGRRGSLHGTLTIIGKQGHIAYPQFAKNPIHDSLKALDALCNTKWDSGNEFFDPTSFQCYDIQSSTGASNVIPGTLTVKFNFRFSPGSSVSDLQKKVTAILETHQLNYQIDWPGKSDPFFSTPGELAQACKTAIEKTCGISAKESTSGGTSDGRFIKDLNCEIVEYGPPNESIHQVNENIVLSDLENLKTSYFEILKKLFC